MRELKFRAWDKRGKKWFVNLPVCIQVDETGRLTCFADGILMQYTGLQSRSGKDVYVGDILGIPEMFNFYSWAIKQKDNKEIVSKIYDKRFCKVCKDILWEVIETTGLSHHNNMDFPIGYVIMIRPTKPQYIQPSIDTLEIIGNIYEHSQLLNKEEKNGKEL